MSYNSSIPLGTDAMVTSQTQCFNNFNAINTVWNQNHLSLTSLANQGMHNSMVFRVQPDPTTSATQNGLYTKNVVYSGVQVPNLFFRPNSSQTPIQLTYPSISTGIQSKNPDVYFPQQYSFSAGPFVIYGGFLTGVSNNHLVTLTPTTTLLFAIVNSVAFTTTVGTFTYNAIAVVVGSGFTFNFFDNFGPQNFYYFAIGK